MLGEERGWVSEARRGLGIYIHIDMCIYMHTHNSPPPFHTHRQLYFRHAECGPAGVRLAAGRLLHEGGVGLRHLGGVDDAGAELRSVGDVRGGEGR